MVSLEYMAGMVDADGCISILKAQPNRKHRTINPRYSAAITVTNTYEPLLSELKEQFGGHIRVARDEEGSHNRCFAWSLTGLGATRLAEGLLPHLRIKKGQAYLIISLQTTIHNGARYNPEVILDMREMLYQKNKELNSGKWLGEREQLPKS